MTPAIHQLVAGYARGDAISNTARALRARFRQWGHASEIFCETRRVLPELRSEAQDLEACVTAVRKQDVALLHLSIGSPANAVFHALPCRKAILYHNMTPPEYFRAIRPETANQLADGRRQLAALRDAAGVNLAVSHFNAAELEAAGFRDVRVLPLLLDFEAFTTRPDRALLRRLTEGPPIVLSVGRVAPNKRIEDAIEAVAALRRATASPVRLVHVGSWAGTEPYYHVLRARCREVGMDGSVFAGALPQAALNAHLQGSRLLLCTSAHEGFCIPLLEAMANGLPVVACAAGAIPETLGGAGVLVHTREPAVLAEVMARILGDAALRAAILRRQEARVAQYRALDLGGTLRAYLAPLLEAPP